jgi:DNA-binding response OmpR family regulator
LFLAMRILLIEDDQALASNLLEYFTGQDVVAHEKDGIRGLAAAAAGEHDAVVLDLSLPRLDGIELCRSLREQARRRTPVLVLTARDTLEDKVAAFDAGADDYLVKPFAMRELAIRLRALVRRVAPATAPAAAESLRCADLELDLATLQCKRGDRPFATTRIGLRILEMLLRASPAVVRRETIVGTLWPDYPVGDGVLRTHVYALRKAIDGAGGPPLLHTLPGIGYRLAATP